MVSDDQDDDLLGREPVRNGVREPAEHVAIRPSPDRPAMRRPQDQINCPPYLDSEPRSQSFPLAFVPEHSMAKISAR
jgi:hypothetical protein